MKSIFLLLISLLFAASNVFGQCLGPSQKIASPICTKPSNAKVNSLSCTELQVQWQGSSDQMYEVNATIKNTATNKTETFTTTEITCDANGTCTATIPVTAGTKVTWSVQAICANEGSTFYSYALRGGKEISIPNCELNEDANSISNVFPNPTAENISVEYLCNKSGNLQFIIYDLMGKVVFTQSEKATQGMSSVYKFNLPNLPSGIYLLEARNGNDVSQKKFVIEK
ncbi:MAG TPA: T9SS type A sorting domain-containing protein [Chitinophagales bacterium]|nr:T9SS type A sorting domain-containing protein [Chitinophagales bacterium]